MKYLRVISIVLTIIAFWFLLNFAISKALFAGMFAAIAYGLLYLFGNPQLK